MKNGEVQKLFEEIGYIRGKVEKIDCIERDVKELRRKLNFIYGWAAGAAGVFSFLFYYIKDKIFNG